VITVTVNTVIVSDADVLRVVDQACPGGRSCGVPVPLTGGFWAQMWRVQVHGSHHEERCDVVVRLAPSLELGAKEAAVQCAVAGQGYPTPAIRLSMADSGRRGWWTVMDLAPGGPLLAGLQGGAVIRQAPRLVKRLPGQLATTMAALHRLDPVPIGDAVRAAAPEVAWTAQETLHHLRAAATDLERDDLVDALDRLADHAPPPTGEVICHGDLHPFNLLADGARLTVLDWTAAITADPSYDVAFTELLLANPPIPLTRAVSPVMRRVGHILAKRFVAAYAWANPNASLRALPWFRALHSARVLLDVTRLRVTPGPHTDRHPFMLVAAPATRHLSLESGINVSP
jgi:aminoglycoside phosphotransferase (APT) family kinase protein